MIFYVERKYIYAPNKFMRYEKQLIISTPNFLDFLMSQSIEFQILTKFQPSLPAYLKCLDKSSPDRI